MTKLSALAITALILLQAPLAGAETPLEQRIDAALAPLFKPDWPGATVIVTRDGKPLFRKAYGLASLPEKTPMQPEMLLRIGSITKQFTAVAILQLAEQGKLALQDDVRQHLPDFPDKGQRITIEHLLQHTSGIPNYTELKAMRSLPKENVALGQVLDMFKDEALEFAPGTQHKYSNSGYFLLGMVIEKLSGKAYHEYLAQNIFEPLGMRDTAHEGNERSARRRINGYRLAGKEIVPVAEIDVKIAYAAGALVTTVDDMARWEAAVSGGKLLKPATWRQAFTACRLPQGAPCHYGYGWNIGTLAGHKMIHHGGSIPGFTAQALRLPDDQVFVAVLTNGNGGALNTQVIAYTAAAIAIGQPFPEHRPMALAPEALDAFVGTYVGAGQTRRVVRRAGDQLTLQRDGRDAVPIMAFGPDSFFMEGSLARLEFLRGADGKVRGLLVRQPGVDETALRQ
ncbi:serine hydrolase [Pseudoduganella sp. DS3]|uniref:Serine hydrolase n=1 Tax=Pseudoduganella guangdongensis TaxID=2692179 RepID=A0A6N9HI28_9BURK|nr:serine hydrolase [Pseudoduganella guangdongensis]MYN02937.1 serine hydrolase [Pseudoduganella guangdongensis]